jgi:hypothetical protein
MSKPEQTESQNQGEGNRTADRQYREAATKSANTDENKQKAREAAAAVESDGEELAEAEQAGKAPARS